MNKERTKSAAEAKAIFHLNLLAKEKGLKGKFYANQIPAKNRDMFNSHFFNNYDISLNNKKLIKYLENEVKKNHISWDFKRSFDDILTHNFNFECDIIYVVKNKVMAIIEVHGAQHKQMIQFYNKRYEDFIITKINDYVKADYCKTFNIPFFETFLIDSDNINLDEIKKIASQLS